MKYTNVLNVLRNILTFDKSVMIDFLKSQSNFISPFSKMSFANKMSNTIIIHAIRFLFFKLNS